MKWSATCFQGEGGKDQRGEAVSSARPCSPRAGCPDVGAGKVVRRFARRLRRKRVWVRHGGTRPGACCGPGQPGPWGSLAPEPEDRRGTPRERASSRSMATALASPPWSACEPLEGRGSPCPAPSTSQLPDSSQGQRDTRPARQRGAGAGAHADASGTARGSRRGKGLPRCVRLGRRSRRCRRRVSP